MTLLVVALPTSLSWHAVDTREALRLLVADQHVSEALLLPHRGELYAESETFHGGTDRIAAAFAGLCGCTPEEFTDRCDPRYDTPAAARLFTAAAGGTGTEPIDDAELATALAMADGTAGVQLVTLLTQARQIAQARATRSGTDPDAVVQRAVRRYAELRWEGQVTPALTALREQAHAVVGREMTRLDARLPQLTDPQRTEVARAAYRVIRQLLHAPTQRIEGLGGSAEVEHYDAALRELFDLDGVVR